VAIGGEDTTLHTEVLLVMFGGLIVLLKDFLPFGPLFKCNSFQFQLKEPENWPRKEPFLAVRKKEKMLSMRSKES